MGKEVLGRSDRGTTHGRILSVVLRAAMDWLERQRAAQGWLDPGFAQVRARAQTGWGNLTMRPQDLVRTCVVLGYAVVAVGGASEYAGAVDAYTQMTRQAYASANGNIQDTSDPSPVFSPNAQSMNLQASATASASSAFASISGTVDFGSIRGTFTSTANASGTELGSAQAAVGASWQDFISLNSATLPVGTPVDYVVSGQLHRVISGDLSSPVGVSGQIAANGLVVFFDYPTQCSGIDAGATAPCVLGDSTSLITTGTLHAAVGDRLPFGGILGIQTGCQVGMPSGTCSEVINASSTELFAFKILTPGVDYTAASGTVYLTTLPVPEPTTYALVLAGLGVIGFVARRNRER